MDQNTHLSETYKSMITISMEAMKALLLINGGAVIALLTFLGNSNLGPSLASHMGWPMGLFILGIIANMTAFICAYWTQLTLFNEILRPHTVESGTHMRYVYSALSCIFIGLLAFAGGCFTSICALVTWSN